MSEVTFTPIDTTLDTVITDQLPDLPPETGGVVVIEVDPPVELPQNTTVPPGTIPSPPTCIPVKEWKGKKDGKHDNSSTSLPPCSETTPVTPPPTCVPVKHWRRINDGKSGNPPSTTLPPCPETTPIAPPTCPPGLKHAPIHARQFSGEFATLQMRLTYGPSTAPVPIRQLQVTGFALVNNEQKIAGIGKTDNNGFVVLQFPVESGTNLLLYQLSVSMNAERYRVSTSPDLSRTFLFWRLTSIPLSYEFGSGLLLTAPTFNYRFMNKATNDILNVHDRTLNSWVFAKTYVANFQSEDTKLEHVWFPGNLTSNYFSNNVRKFINIHPDHATFTSAQAHEYGHFFHYIARGAADIDYPDITSHTFCDSSRANEPVLALTEGYATAFGLSSLWQSRYQETSPTGSNGTAYIGFGRTPPGYIEIEQYNCTAILEANRNISTDEGRVAAALRDLIDANADDNGGVLTRGRGGLTDRTNILRRKVLFDPMVNNPLNMEQYWLVTPVLSRR